LDPQANRKLMTRVLATEGNGFFYETEYDVPSFSSDEIWVRAVMTGVCRSDIDMMQGNFGPLPLSMQGHEGLGKVIGRGANVNDVEIGDFVATRGEPAYADVYNVRKNEYVKVPEAHPRYILEPVACGINVVKQADSELAKRKGKLLILGSGFLAWVAYNTLVLDRYNFEIDVLGSSNQELWGDKLMPNTDDTYDIVIDLSGKYELGTEIGLNNNALIIDAVGKAVSYKEAQQQLWKAVTTIKPSPRTDGFIKCMEYAKFWIERGHLTVDNFWTKGYNRNTEWQSAFADGANRPVGYSRGYIKWL
jgi:D-arabinose 1-dehydrogenase-like Zn-dependent alcohol dehydrogenase